MASLRFGLGFFLIMLLPVIPATFFSNIHVGEQLAGSRIVYIPLMGLLIFFFPLVISTQEDSSENQKNLWKIIILSGTSFILLQMNGLLFTIAGNITREIPKQFATFKKIADKINIIPDENTTSEEFEEAFERIESASLVLFLGFGYYFKNLQRL